MENKRNIGKMKDMETKGRKRIGSDGGGEKIKEMERK